MLEFHFWDGNIRSSAVTFPNQTAKLVKLFQKTKTKVSENCPKAIEQIKKHVFKKIY